MKRYLVAMLALVISFSMFGCKNAEPEVEPEQTNEITDDASGDSSDDIPSIENPWIGCENEDVEALVGIKFVVRDDFKDADFRINEKEKLAEMDFVAGERVYTARIGVTDELTDISGYNYDWNEEVDTKIGESKAVAKSFVGDGVGVDIAYWYIEDAGVTYCISTYDEDLEGFDIIEFCEDVQNEL